MSDKQKEFKKVVVEGIAMYPSVHVPKKAYMEGEAPQYTLDLIVDETNAKILLDAGLKPAKVKIDEDTKKPKEYAEHPGKKVFALKRKTQTRDGKLITALRVIDADTNVVPPTILVGNGSKVRVSVNPYTVTFKGKEVNGHQLLGVQILELVEYTGGGGTRDDGLGKASGFKVPTIASQHQEVDEEDPFN